VDWFCIKWIVDRERRYILHMAKLWTGREETSGI
jgi:hypothetical protein